MIAHPNAPTERPQIGPPTAARWGGTRPAITPRRQAAIQARRKFLALADEGALEGFAVPLPAAALVPAAALELALGPEHMLDRRALELLACIGGVVLSGARGVQATHAELARAIGTSSASARRAVRTLLARGLVALLVGTYEQHGAASSQRGNAYTVPGSVLAGIARARNLLKSEQASGTVSPAGESANADSPCSSPPDACSPSECSPAAPAARSVSASRTVDRPSAVPTVAASLPCPATRQGETRRASGRAPEAGIATSAPAKRSHATAGDASRPPATASPGEAVMDAAWLALLEDVGADPAVREVARELLHDVGRDRRRRELGLGAPLSERERFNDLQRRSAAIAREHERGGEP